MASKVTVTGLPSTVTKKLEGRPLKFRGFDGKDYYGTFVQFRRRIIQIEYYITGLRGSFTAYLGPNDYERLEVY